MRGTGFELLKECPFEFDKSKKLGHMRCDYDGGRNTKPFTSWFGIDGWKDNIDKYNINPRGLDEVVNYICYEKLNSYDKFLDFIGYYEKAYDGINYFMQHDNLDIWIRMIPAKDDYNIYINFYHK
jgi:hypothetical protein